MRFLRLFEAAVVGVVVVGVVVVVGDDLKWKEAEAEAEQLAGACWGNVVAMLPPPNMPHILLKKPGVPLLRLLQLLLFCLHEILLLLLLFLLLLLLLLLVVCFC